MVFRPTIPLVAWVCYAATQSVVVVMPFETSPKPRRQMVLCQREEQIIPERLEPLKLVDIFESRGPAINVLDREVELNESFRKVAPLAHDGLLPI